MSPHPPPSGIGLESALALLKGTLENGERLAAEDALFLYREAPLAWLKAMADGVRRKLHGDEAYFNRNIHFEPTNKCVYACKFCAFYRAPKATEVDGAWDYSFEDLKAKLDAYPIGSLTEIHITGGVHPDRGVEYGEALCAFVKSIRPELHVKAFTAVEITWFAKKSGVSLVDALTRLRQAGLDSLPGGGAEIFDPEVRKRIAGGKAPAHTWLEVHEAAHGLGLLSNATMLYGHVEDYRHRVDHMSRLRDLQDRTKGFKAFIPLRYRNESNALSHIPEVPPEEDLRNYAVARLFLDNIPHLKAYWVMLGLEMAAQALEYGVDDLDGTVDDSTRIYSMAGGMEHPAVTSEDLGRIIRGKGRIPVERDSEYAKLGAP
ncbi:MAG: CofH family radical SAM protein [Fibrobacterota bacterium]|nr:CofH family radical SAM protein [Fibrobacterota bacterium]